MDEKLPPPIQVTAGSDRGGNGPKDEDSLVEFKVKNPFQKFFEWIKNFIKRNQNITIKIPIVGILIGYTLGVPSGYSLGFNVAVSKLFPNSSPILHRAISVEGIIQKSSSGKYYLKASDKTLWTLKPVDPAINLADYLNQQVTAKGNLTKEKLVIEVSDVITLDTLTAPTSLTIPNPSSPSNPSDLPTLYPSLQWETSQRKTLIFTSGKRKIEQEGVYFESSQINVFPQDFINYYIQSLKDASFKETLNSISPDGITITYAKDDLFLTFGIKNIYSGSGDKKQLTGYKAYIEHN